MWEITQSMGLHPAEVPTELPFEPCCLRDGPFFVLVRLHHRAPNGAKQAHAGVQIHNCDVLRGWICSFCFPTSKVQPKTGHQRCMDCSTYMPLVIPKGGPRDQQNLAYIPVFLGFIVCNTALPESMLCIHRTLFTPGIQILQDVICEVTLSHLLHWRFRG